MILFKLLPVLTLISTLALPCVASVLTVTSDSSNSTQRWAPISYVQAAYFTNWGIYGSNFQPTDIDPSQLTQILYAFADVSPETGGVFLTDSWADEEKHFPGDSWNEQENNLYGCLKQLYLLKLAHRHIKVLLSVGDWTYSQDGHFSFLADEGLQANFVSSAVQLVKDYGLDGIDIDFEYPANEADGYNFLHLMTSLRRAFDDLEIANGDATPYELTAAVAAGSEHNAYYPVWELDRVLTYWNLMAYDYTGSWLEWADNQADLYGGSRTGVNTDAAVEYYLSSGATPRKITVGIMLHGRAFENTDGIGQPYNGVGPGTYAYKDLPLPGALVMEDLIDVASYSYVPVTRELISYDIPNIVSIKAEYVASKSLAGCMFWELSSDKPGPDSLVNTTGVTLGQLDQTQNHINKWDNIRNNMGMGSGTPPGVSPTSASNPTSATTSTTTWSTYAPTTTSTPPSSCLCDGVLVWSTTAIYWGSDESVHDGHLWTAKWWTEGDVPGGAGGPDVHDIVLGCDCHCHVSAGVWKDEGACD